MDKKRPSSTRYPQELRERAVRMVRELRLEAEAAAGIVALRARPVRDGVGAVSRDAGQQGACGARRRRGAQEVL
jgi:hypothetical protein